MTYAKSFIIGLALYLGYFATAIDINLRPINTVTLKSSCISSAMFSSDGKQIVIKYLDGSIRVWDAINGHELLSPHVHFVALSVDGLSILKNNIEFSKSVGFIYSANFSFDGKYIVIASTCGTWVYDAKVGQELLYLYDGNLGVISAYFSPYDYRIVSTYIDGRVRVWLIDTDHIIRYFFENLPDEYSKQNIKTLVNQWLSHLTEESKKQEWVWVLFKELDKQGYFDQDLFLALLELITIPDLECYSEARIMQANLIFNAPLNNNEKDDRCLKAIEQLLTSKDQDMINLFVAQYIKGGVGCQMPIELQNISISSKSILSMLKHIKKMNLHYALKT